MDPWLDWIVTGCRFIRVPYDTEVEFKVLYCTETFISQSSVLYGTVKNMPAEGYRTISVSNALYDRLAELAKDEFTTVPRFVEKLVAEHRALKKGRGTG